MYLWKLQLALAGGTVIAEHLNIALLWHLLKEALNHTTARFPHTRQVCLRTKPRCELSMSKHPCACSHLTSATTIAAIKGNQFMDCCLQKQQAVFTHPALPIATSSSSLPTTGFCLQVLLSLGNQCCYLLQEDRAIFVFTVQINFWLCLLISH